MRRWDTGRESSRSPWHDQDPDLRPRGVDDDDATHTHIAVRAPSRLPSLAAALTLALLLPQGRVRSPPRGVIPSHQLTSSHDSPWAAPTSFLQAADSEAGSGADVVLKLPAKAVGAGEAQGEAETEAGDSTARKVAFDPE